MKIEVKSHGRGPNGPEILFGNLLQAIADNSYENLISNGNSNFRASLTPQMVDAVNSQLLPRFESGVATTYMGDLDRKTYISHHWKLSFGDGQGDRLVRLSLKNDKVHAFYIL